MKNYISDILLALCLLSLAACQTAPVASQSWFKHECDTIPGVPDANFCYDQTTADAVNVLWFFHGLEDSAAVWSKPTSVPSSYPDLISAMPPMRIITISFGPGWLLTSYPNRQLTPTAATLDTFKNKIVPYLEWRYQIKGPYKGLAHSMGGHNLAVLWATYPEMWSSVTLINPALITNATDPWNFLQICPWCLMVKANFDNKTEWTAGRPTTLVDNANPGLPPLHITGCSQDVLFNLYTGTQEFRNHSKVHATSVDWHDGDPGCDHWSWDTAWVIRSLK